MRRSTSGPGRFQRGLAIREVHHTRAAGAHEFVGRDEDLVAAHPRSDSQRLLLQQGSVEQLMAAPADFVTALWTELAACEPHQDTTIKLAFGQVLPFREYLAEMTRELGGMQLVLDQEAAQLQEIANVILGRRPTMLRPVFPAPSPNGPPIPGGAKP